MLDIELREAGDIVSAKKEPMGGLKDITSMAVLGLN